MSREPNGRWKAGASGNPGGQPSVNKALRAAGFDPDDLRVEVIQKLVACIRELDRGDKEEGATWRFAMDKVYAWTGLPAKPLEVADGKGALSDAEYEEEIALIGREYVEKLPPEERFKLVAAVTSGETVQ